jgi:protein-L-isoaspartate(D-aspartate) O-methyltransferase
MANIKKPGWLADAITPTLPLPVELQQELLETFPGDERLEKLSSYLHDTKMLRSALVTTLTGKGILTSAVCRRAFLRVPRHRFVPNIPVAAAYLDIPVWTRVREGQGGTEVLSSLSGPRIVAVNLRQLQLRSGLRILEVGAGTGYNAALMAEIVGAENVTSVDLDAEIAAEARAHLDETGYYDVLVDAADGWNGYPARAPYDRIILTVGAQDLAPACVDQLRESGVLVAWLSFRCVQLSLAFRKRKGVLVSEPMKNPPPPEYYFVWGVDMRGQHCRRTTRAFANRLTVLHDSLDEAGLAIIDEILDRSPQAIKGAELTHLMTTGGGFLGYMALAHPCALLIRDPRLEQLGIQHNAWAIADLERRQLAIAGANLCFGGMEVGDELRRLARGWQEIGRPELDRLRLMAYPRTAYREATSLPPGRWTGLIEKENTWFRWRYR